MKLSKLVIAALSTVGILGATVSGTPAQNQTQGLFVTDAERACERALEENTIEALEEYLNKYRHASTACRALALEALGQFAPNGTVPSTDPGDTNTYGA